MGYKVYDTIRLITAGGVSTGGRLRTLDTSTMKSIVSPSFQWSP